VNKSVLKFKMPFSFSKLPQFVCFPNDTIPYILHFCGLGPMGQYREKGAIWDAHYDQHFYRSSPPPSDQFQTDLGEEV
jgi:hypothetical protein